MAALPARAAAIAVFLVGTLCLAPAGEAAAPCRFALSPATVIVPSAAGSGTFALTTGDGCRWRAQDNRDYLAVSPVSGTGSATITVTYDENTGPARTGMISVKDATLTVDQEGAVVVEPPPTANLAPTADAGPDQIVLGGSTVTLSGSGTDPEGQALSYAWTQTGGPAVSLTGATTASASFTAPAATAAVQTLTFQLVVNDGTQASQPSSVVVAVSAADAKDPEPDPTTELSDAAGIAAAFQAPGSYTIAAGTYVGNFVISGSDITVFAAGVRLEPADIYSATLTVLGSRVRVVGLTVANGAPDRDTINIGQNSITSIAALPHDVTFERVTAEAGPNGGHRGFGLHGVNIALIDCRATGFWEQWRDSQAIWVNNGPGPYTIEGGYYEGSGENMMVGGALPGILSAEGVPSDITVRGVHFFKPLEWKNKPGSVKNLFELKSGKRVLVENCVLENNWKDAQAGPAIVIKTDAQGVVGQTPWMETSDVTFRNNIVKNSPTSHVINLRGINPAWPSQRLRNVVIEGNLFIGVTNGIQSGNGVDGLTVRNNTFLQITGTFLSFYDDAAVKFPTPLIFTGNVTHAGAYAVKGDGTASGTATLDKFAAPGYEFRGNVIEKGTANYVYPAGNTILQPGELMALLDPVTYEYLPGGAGY
ncbi:MAG TPA: BACON domain-containing carbohydrate-binding protein [Vicinamibacterales bacterium]|nr:BACON domain-containing carbohydrate-binding protein [Vicinamibacterales bacterium]